MATPDIAKVSHTLMHLDDIPDSCLEAVLYRLMEYNADPNHLLVFSLIDRQVAVTADDENELERALDAMRGILQRVIDESCQGNGI